MPHGRVHNFSAGPAVLPYDVVEQLQGTLPNFAGTGVGLMEISHRSKAFGELFESARDRLRRVLSLPADHTVLILQGGASLQFTMTAMNLLRGGTADFLDTGRWARGAAKDAARFGKVVTAWSGAEHGYDRVPVQWPSTSDRVYTHYTSNNTIVGTQFPGVPEVDGPLICDMSSDIASRPLDGSRFDVIYAGAQKNLGPSGITVVTLSPWALERSDPELPSMLSYRTHAGKGSLFNTPNTLGVFVLERVLAWIEDQGLDQVAACNTRKSGKLYALLDGSDFWRPHAAAGSRSQMNVTWRLADAALEPALIADATAAGFSGLKGHRSVGGLRASLYNALPEESVDALCAFLAEFERTRG